MRCYIVSYDGENHIDYQNIIAVLIKNKAMAKLCHGMWVILSNDSLMSVHEKLKKALGQDENIMIYQVGRKSLAHWQNHPAIKQIQNPEKEPMVYGKV